MKDYTICSKCERKLNRIVTEINTAVVDTYYRLDHENKNCEIIEEEVLDECGAELYMYCPYCANEIEGEQYDYILSLIEGWDL